MKIKNSNYDIAINALCLIMILGTIIYLLVNWLNIPERVPMHHNFAGEVDRWGEKSEIIVLPIFTILIYSFMSVVEHELYRGNEKVSTLLTQLNWPNHLKIMSA